MSTAPEINGSEVDDLLDACNEYLDQDDTKYPGLSYEDGIKSTIEWLRGSEEPPME